MMYQVIIIPLHFSILKAQQEAVQHNQQQLQQPKRKVVINGKPALDMHGDWALMQSSSGKKYYFNVKVWSK